MADLRRIVWLASYHKSGNTWLRAFLANYFAPKGTRKTINDLAADTTTDVRQEWYDKVAGKPFRGTSIDESIAMRPAVQRMIAASRPGSQFVKTHSRIARMGTVDLIQPDVTAAAIYVLRNPFDIAPSYARHAVLPMDKTIDNMCDPKALTASATNIFEILGRWDDHVRSWLEAPGLPRHVMRYEDMLADPERAFRAMLGFLRVPVNDGQLRRAIRAASFKELKKQEQAAGFVERPTQMKEFFASGRSGTWRDALSPEQVARIRREFLPVIGAHYPEMLSETEAFAAGA